jgi:Fe2+ transport system protein FeoA
VLGTVVTVVSREPFDGPLTVQIGEARQVLDTRFATTIIVDDLHLS